MEQSTMTVPETEIKVLDAEVVTIETDVTAIQVKDQNTLTQAGDLLAVIKQAIKHTEEKRKSFTDPLIQVKKAIDAVFNPRIDALEALKKKVENKMKPYQLEQIRLEEERKETAKKRELEEIEKRKQAALEEAAKTNSETMLNVATQIEEYQTEKAAQEVKGHSRTTGGMGQMTTRKDWKHKIVNPDLVPREFCSPDEKKIKANVKINEENTKIPGVEVYPDVVNVNR